MRNIKKIFMDDVLSLAKNFFALVIVIGICFLPALYAWFNIYSNWDPYGNTGALKLAAVSLDKGYTDDDGVYHNQGDTIIENLHENTAVNWQFEDSADEAIEKVYSGEYYAAVIIDEKFSYSMYNVFSDETTGPTLLFYENQKKNPVATKISDTVVQTLQTNINSAFTEVVMSQVFSGANDFYNDMEKQGGIEGLVDKLKTLNADLNSYEETINGVISSDKLLVNALDAAKADSTNMQNKANTSASSFDRTNANVAQTQVTLNTYSAHLNQVMTEMQNTLDEMKNLTKQGALASDARQLAEITKELAADTTRLNSYLTALAGSVTGLEKVSIAAGSLDTIATAIDAINPTNIPGQAELEKIEASTYEALNTIQIELSKLQQDYNSKIVPEVNNTITNLQTVLTNSSSMLTSMGETFSNMTVMFGALQGTLDSANVSLEKTNDALSYVNTRLAEAIDKADSAKADEKMQVLIDTLSGDPEAYGKFFSKPVNVTTEAVYPIENYGSAVAPFYSTLAFWVGALILTAIIKVKPDKSKYPDATAAELYFGRYALYWVLGQLQAIVIVLGDLYLLKIQCIHPGWFMLAASVIATTFTILIYSLVVTWGDVGKALAVVIVVIQIAGSSGTYPIELLPEFFKKVYIFFPFPYAINAIRECLCGMYEVDYLVYLLQLGIFMIVSLAIGLLIRVPFEEINHYMEERMEDTEMM
ncbi:MAG: YhgE/Pip domain-containing protein [Pseudobutyrivibrio sp.]|nr:YhgE/Pip domain-containing protein [Pseudobutyrivibrio sp.]